MAVLFKHIRGFFYKHRNRYTLLLFDEDDVFVARQMAGVRTSDIEYQHHR